jgi:hypothetical protein
MITAATTTQSLSNSVRTHMCAGYLHLCPGIHSHVSSNRSGTHAHTRAHYVQYKCEPSFFENYFDVPAYHKYL